MSLPLENIRILDLTRILTGPFCTMKLGDLGAEVIKIEQPGSGDDTRRWGPPFIGGQRLLDDSSSESAYFLSVNRNKKSVTLDLKSKEGKEIIGRLIARSDVLVENFRAGVMEKLGLDYRRVRRMNPRLVYCSISGYGQTSSRSHLPSYDLIVQGESGLMDMTGQPNGVPTKAGISLADVNAGNMAFEGILLALFQRVRTGRGQLVDISLLDSLLSLFAYQSQIALSSSRPVTRMGNRHPTISPYETFETKEGYINISVGTESVWKEFCRAIGKPGLAVEKRFATNPLRVGNRGELEGILIPILKKRTSSFWIKRLSTAGVPVGEINDLRRALSQKVVAEREMIVSVRHPKIPGLRMIGNPIKLSNAKGHRFSPPPLLGQHTVEVLKDLGYSSRQIEMLKKSAVI